MVGLTPTVLLSENPSMSPRSAPSDGAGHDIPEESFTFFKCPLMFNSEVYRVLKTQPARAGSTSSLPGVCIRQVTANTMKAVRRAIFSSGLTMSQIMSHDARALLAVSSLQRVPKWWPEVLYVSSDAGCCLLFYF